MALPIRFTETDLAVLRTCERLGLTEPDDFFRLSEGAQRQWLAYDYRRQEAITAITHHLSNPGNGRDSMLSPESFAALQLALL